MLYICIVVFISKTLSTTGIGGGNDPVYATNILVSAGPVEPDNFVTRNPGPRTNNLSSSVPIPLGELIQRNNMDPPQRAKGGSHQWENDFHSNNPLPFHNVGGRAMHAGPSQVKAKAGWECPTCTLMNMPQRPGCEMCSTERPASYVVPTNLPLDEATQKAEESERLFKEVHNPVHACSMQCGWEITACFIFAIFIYYWRAKQAPTGGWKKTSLLLCMPNIALFGVYFISAVLHIPECTRMILPTQLRSSRFQGNLCASTIYNHGYA